MQYNTLKVLSLTSLGGFDAEFDEAAGTFWVVLKTVLGGFLAFDAGTAWAVKPWSLLVVAETLVPSVTLVLCGLPLKYVLVEGLFALVEVEWNCWAGLENCWLGILKFGDFV